jgi:cell division protein FtsQ
MTESAVSNMSRASKPSESKRHPERNRRTTPPPVRVPWSVQLRASWQKQRPKLKIVRRIAYWTLQLAAAGVVALGLSAVGKLLLHHLENAPGFATSAIEITGPTQLSKAEIERIAGLAIGKNVFQVSAEQATAKLNAEPWIETATVQRRLPGTYRIQVKERRALALLSVGELYLVGEDGNAFKPLGSGDPGDLPLITGIELASIEHDKHAAAGVLLQAVAFLREYQEAGLSRREPLSEVHVESDETLSAYVGADATFVRLGKAPFRTKLRRLREVFGQLAAQHARAQYVYLDNEKRPDRVTVKLR